jgi:hypothetical protein
MDNGTPRFFGRPGFTALLFGLGLAVFSPPLLGIPADGGGGALWLYLFCCWGAIIAALGPAALSRGPAFRNPRDGA